MLVLVVDENASMRRAFARAVRMAGFDAEAFAHVEDLLAGGIPLDAACLVLDIDQPGSAEFGRGASTAAQALPVVFVSARDPAGVQSPAGTALPLLHKPFGQQELLDAIRLAIRSAPGPAGAAQRLPNWA